MTRAIDIISEQINDNAKALVIGLCVSGMFAGGWLMTGAKHVQPTISCFEVKK